jgi:hypothetical protein
MKKILVGKMNFGGCVDITDPGYDRNVWCRKNDLPFREGTYLCSVYVADDEETEGWGERVASLWIEPDVSLALDPKAYKKICEIGVDTAMAGVFNSPAELPQEKMWDVSEKIYDQPGMAMILDEGIVCKTGYGDGVYPVFGVKNKKGEYIALNIQFL